MLPYLLAVAGEEDDLQVAMSTGGVGGESGDWQDSNPTLIIIGSLAGFVVFILVVTVGYICFWYKKQKLMRIQYQLYPTKVGWHIFD